MPRILFRCDFGEEVGLGHLMRCLGLAEEINSLESPALILMKGPSSEIPSSVVSSGIAFGALPETMGRDRDLSQVQHMVRTSRCDTVVTDGYALDQDYLLAVRRMGVRLVSFDDLNPFPFPSHVVINPNLGAERLEYKGLDAPVTTLLGPRYFVLRRAVRQAVESADAGFRPEVKKVLITMGGSDLLGLNLKALDALERLELDAEFNMVINYLVGDRFRIMARVAELGPEKRITLVEDDKLLPGLMAEADLALAAGGLTKYELAACGAPAIIVSQADNQEQLMARFAAEGACRYLGFGDDVGAEMIARALDELAADADARREMHERGRLLVDGGGARRIAEVILEQ